MAITQEDSISTCPHSIAAGSYYEPEDWDECKLKPTPCVGGYEMCNLDAGGDCEIYEKIRRKVTNGR